MTDSDPKYEGLPLDGGELANLADLYVSIQSHQPAADIVEHAMRERGFVEIRDAEGELVCWVPEAKAGLLCRVINQYKTVNRDPE
jgi:hypothetical protein